MELTPPREDELEVSVVGRGYGECVIVHLGFGDWLVVDSCLDQAEPYADTYLSGLKVAENQLKLLVASHWHDDHVAGFGHMVCEYPSAAVYLSQALGGKEFVELAMLSANDGGARISSGVKEMRQTLESLQFAKRKPRLAQADQRIFFDERDGIEREVWALSPSNAAVLRSKQAFVTDAQPDLKARRRICPPGANESSIALHVRVGDCVALLGADLENEKATDRGWNAVLGSQTRPMERASLYKLAHHGADNGHHPDVWTSLLEVPSIAALTPYGAGRRPRPDDADVKRILGLAKDAYIAGPRTVKRSKARSPVEKMRRRAGVDGTVSERPLGHVRCRKRPGSGDWAVVLWGQAQKL